MRHMNQLATKPLLLTTLLALTLAHPLTHAETATQQTTTSTSAKATIRLNNLLKGTSSLTAHFEQETKLANASAPTGQHKPMLNANRHFSGQMQVQRPNQFRWQTTQPANQLIVANGNTLWIYDPDLEQATRQQVDKQLGNTPALLLSGDTNKINQNFDISQPIANKNYYVLKPKQKESTFTSLSISFNDGLPVMMVLNDALGQTTTIKFSKITRNQNIPASQFSFTPPKGIDIIDQF